jgi:hypothetical protein
MLIIECSKSHVSIIENNVLDVAIWFKIRFMKINRHVVEVKSVVEFMLSFFDDSRQDFESIFNSFDLIECLDIISVESNDVQHNVDFDTIKFEVMIDSNIVNVIKVFQIVSDFEIQLIKMSFDSVFEFVMNDRSQSIIFIIVVVSLNEQIIDELVDENMIRNNKIQFIFEENFRVDIDSIVILSEMKDLERIIRRRWFDDDHVDK